MTSPRAIATILTVGLLAAAAPAGAAAATAWTPAHAVQAGTDPVLAVAPGGDVALGSEVLSHGHPAHTLINLAGADGAFTDHPWDLNAPRAGHGAEPLAALALSASGQVAAIFHDATRPSAVLARVTPGAPAVFVAPQRLAAVGDAPAGQAVPDTATILATTRGELVEAASDDRGALSLATLGASGTRFQVSRGPSGMSATDAAALASDPAGDVFLAGDGNDGCTTVALRRPHGRFRRTYSAPGCASASPSIFDAIVAGSGARAALLSENVSVSGTTATHLRLQVGAHGHFGAGIQLGDALGGPVGLDADADGALTAEWTNCTPGSLHGGRLTLTGCAIRAATGSLKAGIPSRSAAGQTLMAAQSGSTLSALTADRAVVASRCARGTCTLEAFTAAHGGGFGSARRLGTASALIALTGDGHGNVLAVWRTPHGHLLAATASVATGTWRTHTLSSAGVAADQVSAAAGPRGEATVAWSRDGRIFSATVSP